MILIIGGAYQGKLNYAKERFKLTEEDISYCSLEEEPDFSKPCISGLHLFVVGAIQRGIDPIEYINSRMEILKSKIIICDDICSGIVPLEKENRLWRDNTGKILQLLARQSDEVIRLFSGIPQNLL